jgi:prepilin-type processing-associated H-X9-DG protein
MTFDDPKTEKSRREAPAASPNSPRRTGLTDIELGDVVGGTRHPGGVNALLCDGSVRFITSGPTDYTITYTGLE